MLFQEIFKLNFIKTKYCLISSGSLTSAKADGCTSHFKMARKINGFIKIEKRIFETNKNINKIGSKGITK
ncbi:hypothetical protein BpHYR1_018335 [Brachionus plicatilis]|uniref:Uncharacterized protein n=1 Tax=Brachionus plicatilis TaxID=10195 RepID=A0A3M7QWP5_BRAPC|nr:hypothetical protein BpHYR1_018335 [Brachionus plicatilis]